MLWIFSRNVGQRQKMQDRDRKCRIETEKQYLRESLAAEGYLDSFGADKQS